MGVTSGADEPTMATYLTKRGATYYFRRVIPDDLRSAFGGKRELIYSLKTKDRAEAGRLCRLEAVRVDTLFDGARGDRSLPRRDQADSSASLPPATDMLERTARALERLRRKRDGLTTEAQLAAFQEDAKADLRWWQAALDHGPVLYEGQTLAEGLRTAEVGRNALRALMTGEGAMNIPAPSEAVAAVPDVSPVLSSLVDSWAADKLPTAKSVEMWRRTVALFDGHAGRLPVGSITKRQVISFKDHLIAEGKSRATVANRINQLRALFRYAVEIDLIPADPSVGVRVPADKRAKEARVHYDTEALAALFGGPVHALDARPNRGGGEAAYWLPLLALYTGARLNELGQLRPKDVVQERYRGADDAPLAAWVVRFVEEAEGGLTLKTDSSERRVPLHQTLIDLGFLSYVDDARKAGRERLFPDLKPDRFGTVTGNWSKWFGAYLRKDCGVADKRVVFHSLRHSFKHYARECGFAKPVNDAITGHESGDVGDDYGGLDYPLRPLVESMLLYRVPGFEVPLPPPSYRGERMLQDRAVE